MAWSKIACAGSALMISMISGRSSRCFRQTQEKKMSICNLRCCHDVSKIYQILAFRDIKPGASFGPSPVVISACDMIWISYRWTDGAMYSDDWDTISDLNTVWFGTKSLLEIKRDQHISTHCMLDPYSCWGNPFHWLHIEIIQTYQTRNISRFVLVSKHHFCSGKTVHWHGAIFRTIINRY